MTPFVAVWLGAAVTLLVLAYLVASLRCRRPARLGEVHWPGVLVLSVVGGAIPAFVVDSLAPAEVPVPAELQEKLPLRPSD